MLARRLLTEGVDYTIGFEEDTVPGMIPGVDDDVWMNYWGVSDTLGLQSSGWFYGSSSYPTDLEAYGDFTINPPNYYPFNEPKFRFDHQEIVPASGGTPAQIWAYYNVFYEEELAGHFRIIYTPNYWGEIEWEEEEWSITWEPDNIIFFYLIMDEVIIPFPSDYIYSIRLSWGPSEGEFPVFIWSLHFTEPVAGKSFRFTEGLPWDRLEEFQEIDGRMNKTAYVKLEPGIDKIAKAIEQHSEEELPEGNVVNIQLYIDDEGVVRSSLVFDRAHIGLLGDELNLDMFAASGLYTFLASWEDDRTLVMAAGEGVPSWGSFINSYQYLILMFMEMLYEMDIHFTAVETAVV